MMRRAAPARGFTLLEILVALVIFVGSIAVISRLVSLGLDNADFSRYQAEAVLLIENRFAEMDADILESDGATGASDDSFPGWTYDMGTESTGEFLYRVTVTAKHPAGVNLTMTRLFFDTLEAEEAAAQNASASSSASSSSSTGAAAGGS